MVMESGKVFTGTRYIECWRLKAIYLRGDKLIVYVKALTVLL